MFSETGEQGKKYFEQNFESEKTGLAGLLADQNFIKKSLFRNGQAMALTCQQIRFDRKAFPVGFKISN